VDGPSTECLRTIVWKSRYGCRLCAPEDVVNVTSACASDGTKTVIYMTNPLHTFCSGGASVPPTETIACSWLERSVTDFAAVIGASMLLA
jgi:hypothetical protein